MALSTKRTAQAIGLIAAAALALGACGGDDDGSGSSDMGSGGGTASAGGVSAQSIDGTDVLVDSNDQVLYSADEEQRGKVLCTDGCTSIWKPVPASEGAAASSDLDLGEVDRPDGAKQLTYEGAPLYTFTDEGPGELKGDGLTDSFGGDSFTWHAATTTASDSGSSDSAGSGGAYGGGAGY
jgi:predicted lipoprotein with Yx(FWY)xxD motif